MVYPLSVAEYYRAIMTEDTPLPIEQLNEIFSSAWSMECKTDIPIQFKGNDENTMLNLGKEMLRIYIENIKPRKIFAVEQAFSVGIPNSSVRLVGAFDLIEEDDDGNRIITELKT